MAARWPQRGSRRAQGGPKIPEGVPLMAPRGSRRPQDDPKRAQEEDKIAQDRLR